LVDSLPREDRDYLSGIDPSLRGGEDLPGYLVDEVEIARVEAPTTVHAEVTSVRCRRVGKRLVYRVVDDYAMLALQWQDINFCGRTVVETAADQETVQ
jgi:hypothetical protein